MALMASGRAEEGINNERLYVAVSKEWKTCKSTVVWSLQNSGGKRLCLVYVHQPAQYISILGGRFPMSSLSEHEVVAHRQKERQNVCKILDEYLHLCTKAGVQAEKLSIDMETIESGLVELISQHKIERLVMGAAADSRYSRKLMEPKSKKANYVRQYAPDFCHIWFVCKGHLIYTREGIRQPCLNNKVENRQSIPKLRLTQSRSGWSASLSRASSVGSFDDKSSTFSLPHLSMFSRSSEGAMDSISPFSKTEDRDPLPISFALPPRAEEKQHRSLSPTLLERSMNDSTDYQLDQALAEAETAKREAFEESIRRCKAEKEATEAICKANAMEVSYYEELRRRKELEDELAKAKEEIGSMQKQRDTALEELQIALGQKSILKSKSEKSDIMEKELEDKLRSALDLLQNFKKL